MSFLFGKRSEQRAISYQDVWGSGENVVRASSVASALTLVPVYAATSLIADQFASAPWAVYDKTAGVPQKSAAQPELVTNPGGDFADPYSWRFQAAASLLLRGNAYGLILDWDRNAVPSRVVWLNPENVRVDETFGQAPVFYYNGAVIPSGRLVHIPMYVTPGSVVGLSPIAAFKLQIETGMEAQEFGKKFFRRGTTPPGVLKNTSKSMTAEEAQETKRRFLASVSSSEPFVSGSEWDYTAITVPAGEAQFLAGIKASANQIAAAYRVAPEDVGGSSDGTGLTYKNLEQDMIRFNVRTMRPFATRFESVVNRLLPPQQYNRFNLDAGVRADLATRYSAHATAIGAGFETIDEARAYEERQPLTPAEFDLFLQQTKATPQIGSAA